ncbi:outer membrane biogenesis protein BamB [Planctomycetes bacterium CA13]|uniref:Outer membrane biogenesis protein BamB n=1 Tax=Novipirellula herctigrandis TaxID=2527986 RepID=A0A5C5YPA4_9BACT|nr:outer membrane biogenesis protein BamB [Planctomycetes bacterium CA13]
MREFILCRVTLVTLSTAIFFYCGFCNAQAEGPLWPNWRGSTQSGVAEQGSDFPVQWSEATGNAWKVKLPGTGGSTPVIGSSLAFLTYGADGKNHLAALELSSGETRWEVEVGDDRGGKHRKGGGSNPSAVTDGERVFAYFRSGDLACVDVSGTILWQTNIQDRYGEDTLWWDLGTSPILTENAVVVAVMQSGPSCVVALDKESGEEFWKADRLTDAPEEAAQSYATPLNVTVNGKPAIAVMGADHLTLHASNTGIELGRLGGFNPAGEKFFRSIASPVAEGGNVVCPYSRGATITTVNMNALAEGKGADAIVWFRDDVGSDVPSPVVNSGKVYIVGDGKRDRGLVQCLDIKTGKTLWKVRLPKSRHSFSSSPLLAGNYLYVTQENATTFVIGPLDAGQPELVATNALADDEPFTVASPVPVDQSVLLRTHQHLYRFGDK